MPRSLGYRKILVPIGDNPESEKAMDVACRLAADHGALITVVVVVEVPPLLPVNAHMRDEEGLAHRLVERAGAIADSYGVAVTTRVRRGRHAAGAIVDQVQADGADILVIGAPRKVRASPAAAVFGPTVEHVLRKASCRVMVIGMAPAAGAAIRNAAA